VVVAPEGPGVAASVLLLATERRREDGVGAGVDWRLERRRAAEVDEGVVVFTRDEELRR
jgi:hypothetical protein